MQNQQQSHKNNRKSELLQETFSVSNHVVELIWQGGHWTCDIRAPFGRKFLKVKFWLPYMSSCSNRNTQSFETEFSN